MKAPGGIGSDETDLFERRGEPPSASYLSPLSSEGGSDEFGAPSSAASSPAAVVRPSDAPSSEGLDRNIRMAGRGSHI